MVNASGQIEQQLSKLQTRTADLATELEALVDDYLNVLSQASKRQLVLAAYHICTQIYPENFLELSLSQRNRLQQHLRELGNRIQSQLDEKWETAKRLSLRPAEEDGLAVIRQLFLEAASIKDSSDSDSSKPQRRSTDGEMRSSDEKTHDEKTHDEKTQHHAISEELGSAERSQEKLLAEIRTLMNTESPDAPPLGDQNTDVEKPMQPAQLMRRQILIEKAIRDVLKTASEKANEILQTVGVMPEIPQTLLNAASDAERLGHAPMKTPNLVRLSVKVLHESEQDRFEKFEKDDEHANQDMTEPEQWSEEDEISTAILDKDNQDSSSKGKSSDEPGTSPENVISMPRLLQLDSLPDFVLIHLRLSEIEFAETNVAVWRSRIRKKMAHLKRIGHAYKDTERQLAIAQAEDAWRASWTND